VNDFGSMLEAQIPSLRRYSRVLCRDPDRADDLVQDCLCRAMRKRHLFLPGSNLRAWLFTLLHNLYVNAVRTSLRQGDSVPIEDVQPLLTVRPTQGGGLSLRDLERAMRFLSEEQQQVLLLVGLEAMSYDEISSILDLPVGTVRSRLSRGREELRRMLDGEAARQRPHAVPASSSENAPSDGHDREKVRRWRLRAEEIRTNADQFADRSARRSLERAAANYDRMANHAEALLAGAASKRRASVP
jgi:RNA polymerase sigma-70 factor, ECF subfamily